MKANYTIMCLLRDEFPELRLDDFATSSPFEWKVKYTNSVINTKAHYTIVVESLSHLYQISAIIENKDVCSRCIERAQQLTVLMT